MHEAGERRGRAVYGSGNPGVRPAGRVRTRKPRVGARSEELAGGARRGCVGGHVHVGQRHVVQVGRRRAHRRCAGPVLPPPDAGRRGVALVDRVAVQHGRRRLRRRPGRDDRGGPPPRSRTGLGGGLLPADRTGRVRGPRCSTLEGEAGRGGPWRRVATFRPRLRADREHLCRRSCRRAAGRCRAHRSRRAPRVLR